MKFEDIQKANETIKTLDVKGREYAEVNQRIKAFRMLYPEGCIKTEIVSLQDGVVVMKASAYEYYLNDTDFKLLGTGTAYEKENSTFINKTSFIENCETSCVGRSLSMIGLGIDTSIASAEEVQNAINNQDEKDIPKATPKQIEMINSLVDDTKAMLDFYKIEKIEDLTIQQASEIISKKKGNK